MLFLTLSVLALAASTPSQKERCAPYAKRGSMACVKRIGHCVALSVDGQPTAPLTDKATATRVHAIKHGEDVCWQVARPVSTRFRARAQGGGIDPTFVGQIESVDVILYELSDYDPEVDRRLDALRGTSMEADGYRDGTWQVRSPRPLSAGEYVAVFRIHGTDNWDKQAVLLTLDPALSPAPADEGTRRSGPAAERR